MGARGQVAAISRGSARRPAKRHARRRPWPWPKPSAVLALLCLSALLVLAFAPLLPVSTAEVRGGRHVTREGALIASGLDGVPVFRASAAEARARLRSLPAVRDATVEVELPGTARIVLAERTAVGRWIGGELEWFVDAEGMVFGSADASAAPALRVRDDRVPPGRSLIGERLDPALVAAGMRLAALAPGELRPDLTRPQAVMTAGPSGLVLRSGAGWEIRFGSPDRFSEKLALAARFLRDEPGRRLDYLDVRSLDHVVISPQ